MPEGDTIWRAARALDAALAGKTVLAFASSLPAVTAAAQRVGLAGRMVKAVEARGKHLLVRFSGGPVLHTHQGMRGSWRLHRPRRLAAWPPSARAVIVMADVVAVCSLAPVVELLSAVQAAAHPALSRLGPDLLGPDFDAEAARRRLPHGETSRSAWCSSTRPRSRGSETSTSRRCSSSAGSRPSRQYASSMTDVLLPRLPAAGGQRPRELTSRGR